MLSAGYCARAHSTRYCTASKGLGRRTTCAQSVFGQCHDSVVIGVVFQALCVCVCVCVFVCVCVLCVSVCVCARARVRASACV